MFLAVTHGEQAESNVKICFSTIYQLKFIKIERKIFVIITYSNNFYKNLNTKKKDSESKTPLCLTHFF